jgi:lauroyl/myristoyl acyltransferase
MRGWRPALQLIGCEHLERALADGRGAILWQPPLAFSGLLAKMALWEAGFRCSHLSRVDHGISRSHLGALTLNRLFVGAEERYLAERLVMAPGRSFSALKELRLRVEQGALVSITAGSQGRRCADVAFLGGTLRLADGPPALALATGAPLHPVFTVRAEDGTFLVMIEPPLRVPAQLARPQAIGAMLAELSARFERCVLRWPDQFGGWEQLGDPPEPSECRRSSRSVHTDR